MWFWLFKLVAYCFIVTGVARGVVLGTEFTWSGWHTGKFPNVLSLSFLKFLILGHIFAHLNQQDPFNQLAVIGAALYYTLLTWSFLKFHRVRHYSWPGTLWALLLNKGEPNIVWPE